MRKLLEAGSCNMCPVRMLATAVIGVSLTITGCGLFPAPVDRVPSAALSDVRSIGAVRGEASSEIGLAGEAEEVHTFVIDVGGAGAGKGLDKAVSLFLKHQWEVIGEKRSAMVSMKSTKWDAHLSISSYDPYYLQHHPNLIREVRDGSAEARRLVIVKVDKYHGG